MKLGTIVFALTTSVAASLAIADDCTRPPPPPRHGGPGEMSQEMLNQCKGKEAGSVIEVKMPDGRSMKGTCQMMFVPERPKEAPPA